MTWVRKIRGNYFLYKSVREPRTGRVRSMYMGTASASDYANYKAKYKRANKYGDRRTAQARHIDMSTKADTVLMPTDANIAIWHKDKDMIDLHGYDTPYITNRQKELTKEIVRVRLKTTRPHVIVHDKKLTGVELEGLYKIADRYDVARDLIDWYSLIDSTLTYDENKTQLTKYISKMGIKSMKQLIEEYQFYREEMTERETQELKKDNITLQEYPQYRQRVMNCLIGSKDADFYEVYDCCAIPSEEELQGTLEQMERDGEVIQSSDRRYMLL